MFNQLPLLELFHSLIYLFILTVWFFFFLASPIPPAGGIESGESWVVVLSGVVKIHLARQFISIHILRTHPFIYLSGTIKINWFGLQSARLLFYHGFLWFPLNRLLGAAKLCYNTSCCRCRNGHDTFVRKVVMNRRLFICLITKRVGACLYILMCRPTCVHRGLFFVCFFKRQKYFFHGDKMISVSQYVYQVK